LGGSKCRKGAKSFRRGAFTTAYAYNVGGDLTQVTYPSGRVVTYTAAATGNITSGRMATVADQTRSTTLINGLTYDSAGNTLTKTLGNGATQAFNYDNAGNQTSDASHNYTFNAENQITQMDAGAAVYGYDGCLLRRN